MRVPAVARPGAHSDEAATEQSWHRRARRARQAARAVLAVANARGLLAAHHGGGMGGTRDGKASGGKGSAKDGVKYEDWVCPLRNCLYHNFGHRQRCRQCDAWPSDGRKVKGAGKGGAGDAAYGGGGGGIAAKQIHQQEQARRDQQRAVDKLRSDSRREIDQLRKELAEAKKVAATAGGAMLVDIGDGEGDDDAEDDHSKKEQQLVDELKTLEGMLHGLPEAAQFRTATKARIDEAKEELRCLREQRGGPEAKVLGAAGKHQKELRTARAKLLRKSRTQKRLEGEVEDLEAKVAEWQEQLKARRGELAAAKEDAQQAHDELQRLSMASAEGERPAGDGGGVQNTGDGRKLAAQLVEQLKDLLPPAAMGDQLTAILAEAAKHQEQQRLARQQADAAAAAEAAAAIQKAQAAAAATASSAAEAGGRTQEADDATGNDVDEEDDQMADLAGTTLAMLDNILAAARPTGDGDGADGEPAADGVGETNSRRAKLVAHLKKNGATPASMRGVIKDLKVKPKPTDAQRPNGAAAKQAATDKA